MNAPLTLAPRSSLGRKFLMALTGLGLTLFVIAHMLGNFQVFLGRDALNTYAAALKHMPGLLWTARAGLLYLNVSWFRAVDVAIARDAPDFALLTDVPQLRANSGLVVPLISWVSGGASDLVPNRSEQTSELIDTKTKLRSAGPQMSATRPVMPSSMRESFQRGRPRS